MGVKCHCPHVTSHDTSRPVHVNHQHDLPLLTLTALTQPREGPSGIRTAEFLFISGRGLFEGRIRLQDLLFILGIHCPCLGIVSLSVCSDSDLSALSGEPRHKA